MSKFWNLVQSTTKKAAKVALGVDDVNELLNLDSLKEKEDKAATEPVSGERSESTSVGLHEKDDKGVEHTSQTSPSYSATHARATEAPEEAPSSTSLFDNDLKTLGLDPPRDRKENETLLSMSVEHTPTNQQLELSSSQANGSDRSIPTSNVFSQWKAPFSTLSSMVSKAASAATGKYSAEPALGSGKPIEVSASLDAELSGHRLPSIADIEAGRGPTRPSPVKAHHRSLSGTPQPTVAEKALRCLREQVFPLVTSLTPKQRFAIVSVLVSTALLWHMFG